MNKLDFNIKAGWPGSTETFEWLQNMVLQAQGGAQIGGKYWIVSGCVESAGNVSDGIVCLDGELLPFVGGPVQSSVIIVDTATNREFFGGALNPYYHDRKATFGTGSGAVAWSDFKRNNPNSGVLARLDKVEKMLKPLMGYEVGGITQYGSWLFWGRPANEIPDGWEAVPDSDWKGRVPVVMNDLDVDFNTVGKTGGEKKHTLTIAEMPSHSFYVASDTSNSAKHPTANDTIAWSSNGGNGNQDYDLTKGTAGASIGKTNTVGGNAAHNNMQPYKVVMFIRFIG